jgi:hypothetical protein
MLVMNLQEMREAHVTSLHEVYNRIAGIAKNMGGRATEGSAHRRRTFDVAEPRNENVPALVVEMLDSFRVEFAPADVLRPGALSVRARRTHHGRTKNDWTFNYLQGIWQYAQKLVSDDDIRKCLMPEGPRAALF